MWFFKLTYKINTFVWDKGILKTRKMKRIVVVLIDDEKNPKTKHNNLLVQFSILGSKYLLKCIDLSFLKQSLNILISWSILYLQYQSDICFINCNYRLMYAHLWGEFNTKSTNEMKQFSEQGEGDPEQNIEELLLYRACSET